jgi:hypothetical protein
MNSTDLATTGSLARFCNECGNSLAASMKFCGGCGAQIGSTPMAPAATAASPGSSAGADDALTQINEPSLTLVQGWGYYAASLLSLAVLFWLAPSAVVLGYLAVGVFMSRFVMRRLVQWHPQYNTLHNVVSAKFWMVLLWPWRMLVLLVQLGANHLL